MWGLKFPLTTATLKKCNSTAYMILDMFILWCYQFSNTCFDDDDRNKEIATCYYRLGMLYTFPDTILIIML